MRKNLIILLILVSHAFTVNAQSFEYIYSTPDDEVIIDAIQDSQGNYYLAGYKGTFPGFSSGNYSGLIIKLSPSGDTLKTLIISPVNTYVLLQLTRITDSIFIAFGDIVTPGTNDSQILYLKFDQDLNILDQKILGDTAYNEYIYKAHKGIQNEMLLTGYAANGNNPSQLLFYRVSLNGDSLQSFYMGDSANYQFGLDVLELPDTSGYLIFSFGMMLTNYGHTEIFRLNSSGIIDTIITLPAETNPLKSVTGKWLSDSTFALASFGYDSTAVPFNYSLNFTKFDINFNVLADTLMGATDTMDREAYTGLDFIDNNKIFGGGTINLQGSLFEPDPAYYYLIKFNSDLMPQWEKVISHNDDYLFLLCVHATNDGGVLLAGTRYNDQTSGINERDIYIIKLDSLGNFVTGINEQPGFQVHDVIIYPNPVHDVINIKSTISFSITQFTLYDAAGRIVLDKKFTKQATFLVAYLQSGIYFYEVRDKEGKAVYGKVVKQ